jgi:DNA-binding NtrC family response regulator
MGPVGRIVAVIEDEPAQAEALALVLRDRGAEVAVGAHPSEIVKQLGPRVADIGWIITDFDLGEGQNGIELANDMVAASAPQARVLVLSSAIDARIISQSGFDAMDKPAQVDKIMAWLERA